ncbi:MAG TPA: lactonase family protein [Terracidiphilus sp.]|nr:lactonase family protein [Terracidiphilus sp.]
MKSEEQFPTWSRRTFLESAAALAVTRSLLAAVPESSKTGRVLAYVGTYTSAVDGAANGEGIYLAEMDPRTGGLTQPKLVAKTPNPSWLCVHPSKQFLYAINEVTNFEGSNGSVSAFRIEPADGGLTPLNTISSEGAGPAHMSLDATGKYVFVANYVGGSIAVLPIQQDGSLGAAVDVHRDTGSVGSTHAADAPRGSFAISGHDTPHAHMIAPDPQNRFVLATDLAQDRIYVYRFDPATGKLTPSESTPFVSLPSGDGPRHFAFHPNGRWLYLLAEESSTIAFFHYDSQQGSLAHQKTTSALPAGFAGTSFASEILVSADGKTIYSANRLHDTISICSIGADGSPALVAEVPTLGDYPRNCEIDPTGTFLFVCDQRSDCIASFRIHRENGALTPTGEYTAVGSPAMITFLR